MRRIRNIPLIIGISVGLILLFLVSLRGAFRSSLINDTSYTPVTTMDMLPTLTGTGAQFEPFAIFEERNQTYQTNLDVLKTSGNLGVYFPSIYRISSQRISETEGGSIDVALHVQEDLTFEQSIGFTIEYPADVMTYAGATTATNELGTITANGVSRPGFLDVVFVPSEGKKLFAYQEVLPMLRIPFRFTNVGKIDLTKPVMLRITNGKKMGTNLVEVPFPVQDRPVDLLYFETSALTDGVIESRGVVTGEVPLSVEERQKALEAQRALLTFESPAVDVNTPAPISTPPAVTTQANTAPEVTADQTRVSPASLVAGETTPVYVYLSIADAQGIDDIRQVTVNLTSVGLEADRALLLVNTGPRYGLYATTFSLPVTLAGSDVAYTLPYIIRDRGGNEVQGALSVLVRPKPVTQPQASIPALQPTTPVTPVTSVPPTTTAPTAPSVPVYAPQSYYPTYAPYSPYTPYPPTYQVPSPYPVYTQPPYTGQPSASQNVYVVEVDMDRNGVVDANDLQLFLQAYQQLSTKR